MDNMNKTAQENLQALKANTYPGRMLILGMTPSGRELVQIYAITSRSENNRNRVLVLDTCKLFTVPADPAKVKEPNNLIYYDAMGRVKDRFVVSNGNQTETVLSFYCTKNGPLGDALTDRTYEPDPNSTSRITGMTSFTPVRGVYYMEIVLIRKSPFSIGRIVSSFKYDQESIPPGLGYFVSTYSGDGNPLPAFTGEPLPMPIQGDLDEIAEGYWNSLNKGNKVCLAVNLISVQTRLSRFRVINQYPKV